MCDNQRRCQYLCRQRDGNHAPQVKGCFVFEENQLLDFLVKQQNGCHCSVTQLKTKIKPKVWIPQQQDTCRPQQAVHSIAFSSYGFANNDEAEHDGTPYHRC